MKWLILALLFSIIAIIVMIIGLFKYRKITNAITDTDEEKQANMKKGQSSFFKYVAVATAFIIVAIIIRFVTGGTVV